MKHHILSFILFFLIIITTTGCQNYDFTKVETNRASLIDGIESYQSIEEFKVFLKQKNWQWEVLTDSKPPTGNRPPFNHYTIGIKNYIHDNTTGELHVSFFNNRLQSTIFYPSNPDYIKQLINQKKWVFDKTFDSYTIVEAPYAKIMIAKDNKGQQYVSWSDLRLDRELSDWISKYS